MSLPHTLVIDQRLAIEPKDYNCRGEGHAETNDGSASTSRVYSVEIITGQFDELTSGDDQYCRNGSDFVKHRAPFAPGFQYNTEYNCL